MRGFRGLVVAVMAAALVVSCVPAKKVKPTERPKTTRPVTKKLSTGREKARIDKHLKKGEYREALVVISRAIKKGEKESVYRDEREKAINGLIGRGRALEDDRNLSGAARSYMTALDYYPKGEVSGINEPPGEIRKRLRSFVPQLMDDGLRKYRAGELEEAIGIWDTLLSIDPRHAEAGKARETARTQLRNLRKIK